MKFLAIFLSVLTLAFADTNLVKINANKYTALEESKLIGGEITDISILPWQVSISRKKWQTYTFLCSGNLISNDVVLTVARYLYHKNVSNLIIRAGSNYYTKNGIVLKGLRAAVHPKYAPCQGCLGFDIALLFLTFSATVVGIPVKPIGLWDADAGAKLNEGTRATLSGWGAIRMHGLPSRQLRRLKLTIAPFYYCNYSNRRDSFFQLCTALPDVGKGTCPRDNGDGLVINGKLAGIAAFGFNCGNVTSFTGYASIPAFRDWIKHESGI